MLNSGGQRETLGLTDSDFPSHGMKCAGWLCRPKDIQEPPIVIMAHGFAAERTFGLLAFAEKFVLEGMAAFVFDYRNFGASEGQPRNLVSPSRQLDDWIAAIAHVRALKGIDHRRVALWGSSFSGGHVIVTAAKDQRISAIVSQVPFVDGLTTAKTLGMRYALNALSSGFKDLTRMLAHRAPYMVPVVGDPLTFAVMNTPGTKEGYLALVPKDSSWKNHCPARILLSASFYRPIAFADKVTCPALVVMAEKDSLIPAAAVERTGRRMPRATLIRFPAGHFDVYAGEMFQQVVSIEADFLKKHLASVS